MFDPTGAHKLSLKYILTNEIRTKHEQIKDLPVFGASYALSVAITVTKKKAQKCLQDRVSAKKYPYIPRGDVDNLAKTILDAGNSILWEDDCQIQTLFIRKEYGESDQTKIEVTCEN